MLKGKLERVGELQITGPRWNAGSATGAGADGVSAGGPPKALPARTTQNKAANKEARICLNMGS